MAGEEVPIGAVALLGDRLGIASQPVESGNSGETAHPAGETDEDESGDEQRKAVQKDPHQRRRALRTILWKLDWQKRWWPNCLDPHAVVRGFAQHEGGVARDAVAVLLRCGWLKPQHYRRSADVPVGLDINYSREISDFIRTGTAKISPLLAEWLDS